MYPTSTPTPRPTAAPPTTTPTLQTAGLPEILVASDRFAFEPDTYTAEVQSFLEEKGSVLAQARVPVGDGEDSFAHALVGHCIRYGLNPKVLLALIEVESGLVSGRGNVGEEKWALGYREAKWQGLDLQLQWATYTLADGFRQAEAQEAPLLTDGTLAPIPGEANAATQSVLRLLAYTADARRFALLRSDGPGSFVAVYQQLFGQDPRLPLGDGFEPVRQPFLHLPFRGAAVVSSYFDHEYPIFRSNGTILPYTGERGYESYDGHDGWDYVLPAGTPVLAAAAGRVAFAGALDTLCATPANLVVLDHGNGYRTLYWHLQTVEAPEGAEVAAGERLGTVGSTGCSSGPHLHFSVEFLGRDTDPYGWCGSAEVPDDPWASHPAGTVSRWLWSDSPSPCPVPAAATIVDDKDARFTASPALWYEAPVGYAGHAFWAIAVADARESTHRGVWRPELPAGGYYFLYAYIPWYDTGRPDTTQAHYTIHHASGATTVTVDQAHSTGLWVPLGEFYFNANGKEYVYLDEVTGEADTSVWFDAVVWVKK
jgi:murein DD-endopeptidase MepM/ murein hydrolase activator NlpD